MSPEDARSAYGKLFAIDKLKANRDALITIDGHTKILVTMTPSIAGAGSQSQDLIVSDIVDVINALIDKRKTELTALGVDTSGI